MTVAPPSDRPVQGRHRASDDAPTGSFGAFPYLLDDAPRVRGSHRAPTTSLSRAARTAGLSLAALGALATAGGVTTSALASADGPAPTGESALPNLAANDLSLKDAPVVAAPAVMPAASTPTAQAAAATTTSKPTPTTSSSPKATKKAAPKAATSAKAKSSDSDDSSSSDSAGSSVAAKAVAAAKSKIGDPYVWGASGPNSFDCSGLTSWAYKQAGKSLPRTSSAQSQVGQKVSFSNLQPGDLIFFYSPVSHVAMYVGNGTVVEAPTAGEDVKLTSLSKLMKNAVSARRVA